MTFHVPHLGGLSGFVHTHQAASIIAAVAIVGGGMAATAVAWDSTQSSSPAAVSHVGHMTSQATRQLHQWTAHHRAYQTQMGWLRSRHGYQGQHWLAHYRGYQHQLGWLRAHHTWAHGQTLGSYQAYQTRFHNERAWISHHHAYQTQLGWLTHHRSYQNQHWLAHYRGYQHQLGWLTHHRGYGHGQSLGHYRAYQTRMHWLRQHWTWTGRTCTAPPGPPQPHLDERPHGRRLGERAHPAPGADAFTAGQ